MTEPLGWRLRVLFDAGQLDGTPHVRRLSELLADGIRQAHRPELLEQLNDRALSGTHVDVGNFVATGPGGHERIAFSLWWVKQC